jgi:soluble lytic murein transglycosylase-like protein
VGVVLIVVAAVLAFFIFATKAKGETVTETPKDAPLAKYPYSNAIHESASLYGVDPDLIAAIISWEQRSATIWNPNAVNPSDPSYGLGQITPYIGYKFGILNSESDFTPLFVPEKNIKAVAAFLDYLLNDEKYALPDAIQMYNEGEPQFWSGSRVPDYLDGVMGYYNQFRGF